MDILSHTNKLIGHDKNQQSLMDYYQKNPNKGQQWIFYGPKGIGKATCAFIYAHYMLTHNDETQAQDALFDMPASEYTPSDISAFPVIDKEASTFRQIINESHPFITYIHKDKPDPEKNTVSKNITIRHIRHLLQKQALAHGGQKNIIIIDGAEDMTNDAANALLKFFEEPQQHTIIILITHRLFALLPTIRSRAMKCYFNHLSPSNIDTLLPAYRPDINEQEQKAYKMLGKGSFGTILDLYDDNALQFYEEWVYFLRDTTASVTMVTGQHPLIITIQGRDDKNFILLRTIISTFMQELVNAYGEKRPFNAIFSVEQDIAKALYDKISLENLLILWKKSTTELYMNDAPQYLAKEHILLRFLRDFNAITHNQQPLLKYTA